MRSPHFAWRHAMDAQATRTAADKENEAGENARVLAKGAVRALGTRINESDTRTPLKRPLSSLHVENTPSALRTPLAQRNAPNGALSTTRRPLGALSASSAVSPAQPSMPIANPLSTPRRVHKSPRAAARLAMLADMTSSDARAVTPRPRTPHHAGHSLLRAVVSIDELYALPVDTCSSADPQETWSVEEAAGLVLPRIEDISVSDKCDTPVLDTTDQEITTTIPSARELVVPSGAAPSVDVAEGVPLSVPLRD